jgi:serine protease Do
VIHGLAQDELDAKLAASHPGGVLNLDIWRGGALGRTSLHLGEAVAELPATPGHRIADKARLGLRLTVLKRQLAELPAGLYVESATGSALLAGLERGDRIVAVNAMPVSSPDEFDAALARAGGRDPVALLVERGSALAYVPVIRE